MAAAKKLARRERDALEALHRIAPCTAAALRDQIGGTYSAARAVLYRLVGKGLASQRWDGPRYVYETVEDSSSAGKSALREIINTFFQGSSGKALGALLALARDTGDDEELKRLDSIVATVRRGRSGDPTPCE